MKETEPYKFAIVSQITDMNLEELKYISKVCIDLKKNRNICEECGSILQHREGCTFCPICGESKCEL